MKRLFAAFAAAAVMLPLAQAQNEQIPREHRFGRAVPADKLLDRDVVTQSGKSVGQIEDVVFDLESGRILFIGLNPKGSGQGDMVAVPPGVFGLPRTAQAARERQDRDRDEGGLRARLQGERGRGWVIKANEQALEGAPKYPRSGEQMVQASFVDKVYAHFNQPRWWEGAAGSKAGEFNNVWRASQLQKLAVQNSSNEKLGQIETALFDVPAGRVSYVLLDPANRLSEKQVLLPIPPMAFTRGEERRTLILGVDNEKLNNAPSINRDELKAEDIQRLSNPAFAAKVYNYYGKQPWFRDEGIPTPTGRERGEQDDNN